MKRPVKPRAIVFDLDGTLIDSMTLVLEAIAHAIKPFGPEPALDIFAKLGGPPERFLATLVDDARHVPAALQRLEAYHREHWRRIQPFADVRSFLERLRAAGTQLAVWTGRDRESGAWLLRELQLDGLFDTVVFGDDLPSHKPDPAGLREIMRRLGVTPPETLFVGDADVDVLGGAACGVDTVLIHHERAIAAEVRAQSWQNVASPRAALELVLRSVE